VLVDNTAAPPPTRLPASRPGGTICPLTDHTRPEREYRTDAHWYDPPDDVNAPVHHHNGPYDRGGPGKRGQHCSTLRCLGRTPRAMFNRDPRRGQAVHPKRENLFLARRPSSPITRPWGIGAKRLPFIGHRIIDRELIYRVVVGPLTAKPSGNIDLAVEHRQNPPCAMPLWGIGGQIFPRSQSQDRTAENSVESGRPISWPPATVNLYRSARRRRSRCGPPSLGRQPDHVPGLSAGLQRRLASICQRFKKPRREHAEFRARIPDLCR